MCETASLLAARMMLGGLVDAGAAGTLGHGSDAESKGEERGDGGELHCGFVFGLWRMEGLTRPRQRYEAVQGIG